MISTILTDDVYAVFIKIKGTTFLLEFENLIFADFLYVTVSRCHGDKIEKYC